MNRYLVLQKITHPEQPMLISIEVNLPETPRKGDSLVIGTRRRTVDHAEYRTEPLNYTQIHMEFENRYYKKTVEELQRFIEKMISSGWTAEKIIKTSKHDD